ncbi:MAG: NAD-dependent epimerase/dehydratase family protein [Roseibium sp.]|nr:NAD-dependent epimerase/dehydratase family protein [Roseibium sp.]
MCKHLLEADWEVIGVDNFVNSSAIDQYWAMAEHRNFTHFSIDLNDAKQLEVLPTDVDVVFHLAAINGTQNFYDKALDVARSCTIPTLNLIDKFTGAPNLSRFVFTGTSESYACSVELGLAAIPTPEDVLLSIDNPKNLRWSYAAGKTMSELFVLSAAKQCGMPTTILRYHNTYGPRMGDKHFIPDFVGRALRGQFELYGYDQTRSFIYVEDAVDLTVRAALAPNLLGDILNVGSEEELEIQKAARIILEELGMGEQEIECHPAPPGSVSRRCPDVSKARRLFPDWSPRDFRAGVKQLVHDDLFLRQKLEGSSLEAGLELECQH